LIEPEGLHVSSHRNACGLDQKFATVCTDVVGDVWTLALRNDSSPEPERISQRGLAAEVCGQHFRHM
jgi:hypothetical protein